MSNLAITKEQWRRFDMLVALLKKSGYDLSKVSFVPRETTRDGRNKDVQK